MSAFRLPKSTQRTAIVGSTGTGKSQSGLHLLSLSDLDVRPHVVIDYKRDDLIEEIGGEIWPLNGKAPTKPGLYIVQPLLDVHDDAVEALLVDIWRKGHTGLFIDEGYMIPRMSRGMKAIYTQGRSKHVSLIMLSQRPSWCNPFMFSESDFLQVFRLNKPEDTDKLQDCISFNIKKRLPEYTSYWYDVGRDKGFILEPAPGRDEIIDTFDRRLKRQVKVM